jgi:peptidoglycan/LPS O-acetylase OafA/YrhL
VVDGKVPRSLHPAYPVRMRASTASRHPIAATPPADRLAGLDALRGLAALAVVLYHYTSAFPRKLAVDWDLALTVEHGNLGVHLFFIISGFVIMMTLERTRRPLDFAVARFARLYPAYWAGVALTFTVATLAALPGYAPGPGTAVANLTMLQSFFRLPDIDEAYWTLAFEITFYVLVAAIWWSRLRRHLHLILLAWLGMACLYAVLEPGLDPLLAVLWRKALILRFVHLFVLGLVLYEIYRHGPSRMRLLLLAAALGLQGFYTAKASFGLIALFAVAVHLGASLRLRLPRALLWLGAISYTLYLSHQTLGYVLLLQLDRAGIEPHLAVALTTALAIGLASVLTLLVERPAMRAIKRRWRSAGTHRPALQSLDAARPVGLEQAR